MEGERNRYIAFEIICSHEITFKALTSALWNGLYTLFGENGTSKTGLWVVALNRGILEEGTDPVGEKSTIQQYRGILRMNHRSTEIIRTVLAFISEIDGIPALIHVLGISGTIKAARNKYLSPSTSVSQK